MKTRIPPLARLADAHPLLTPVRPTYPLRDLTPEDRVRYAVYAYAKYEQYPAQDEEGCSVVGRFWTQPQLNSDVRTLSFDCPFHEDCEAGRVEISTVPTNGPLGWGRSGADLASITVNPSIKRSGPCCWHGFVVDGMFQHCGDSR